MLLTIKHFYTQGRGSTLQIRWKIIMLGKTGGLFTDSKFDISHACFALYVATPMEFALAALFDLGLDRFEAAVAAHGSTPVGSSGVFLAHPSLCSERSNGVIGVTVIGRSFKKHQVVGSGDVLGLPPHPQPPLTSGLDARRTTIFLL